MAKNNLQKGERVTMWRSEIKPHPHNPRIINDGNRKALKKRVKEVGLLGTTFIVNQTTGHLLSGHQRLSILDDEMKYKDGKNDYELDVDLVCVNEKQELEMLVFFNNPSGQGDWDKELLAKINLDFDVSFADMGFDNLDVNLMFDGDSRFSTLFEDNSEVKQVKHDLQEIKEHRKESTEKLKEANNIDFYVMIVCANKDEKAQLLRMIKVPEHESYIPVGAIMPYVERGNEKQTP